MSSLQSAGAAGAAARVDTDPAPAPARRVEINAGPFSQEQLKTLLGGTPRIEPLNLGDVDLTQEQLVTMLGNTGDE